MAHPRSGARRCQSVACWKAHASASNRCANRDASEQTFEVGARRLTCAGGTAAMDMMLSASMLGHGGKHANRVAEHCPLG